MSRAISEDAVRLDNRRKVFLRLITLAALALGFAGCGRLAQRGFGGTRGTAGTGNLTTATMESDGITRTYHIHMPPSYNGSGLIHWCLLFTDTAARVGAIGLLSSVKRKEK
jgi:hypothetical protein